MLTQLLTKEVISIEEQAHDWRHAIELATAALLANGTIEPSYVAALYRSHQELGPYYVLGPGIAMPHARPEDGVNRLGVSLTLIKQGVNFNSEGNDPIYLLITLAAKDSNSHLETIAQLAELFMNEEDIAAIIAASNKDEILRILAHYPPQQAEVVDSYQ